MHVKVDQHLVGLKERAVATEDAARAHRGVYGISVMSELSGVGPQTLRLYERRGLLAPAPTGGGTRRYSEADLSALRRISALIDDGINLAGISVILALEAQNAILTERIAQLNEPSGVGPPAEVTFESGRRSPV